jgi:hypothetical protein
MVLILVGAGGQRRSRGWKMGLREVYLRSDDLEVKNLGREVFDE